MGVSAAVVINTNITEHLELVEKQLALQAIRTDALLRYLLPKDTYKRVQQNLEKAEEIMDKVFKEAAKDEN